MDDMRNAWGEQAKIVPYRSFIESNEHLVNTVLETPETLQKCSYQDDLKLSSLVFAIKFSQP
jgi:hypothetical protein